MPGHAGTAKQQAKAENSMSYDAVALENLTVCSDAQLHMRHTGSPPILRVFQRDRSIVVAVVR